MRLDERLAMMLDGVANLTLDQTARSQVSVFLVELISDNREELLSSLKRQHRGVEAIEALKVLARICRSALRTALKWDATMALVRRERDEWKQLYERQLKVNEELHQQLAVAHVGGGELTERLRRPGPSPVVSSCTSKGLEGQACIFPDGHPGDHAGELAWWGHG